MYLLIAFIAGALCKLYDDIEDAGLAVAQTIKEALKMAHAVLFCAVAAADYNFAFLCYIVNLINAFLNPGAWTGAYEKACLYVLWIPCLLAIVAGHRATPSNLWDVAIMAVLVTASAWDAMRDNGAGIAAVPPGGTTVPSLESEISLKKLGLRAAGAVALIVAMAIIPFSGYVKKSAAYILGYLLMSCAFQIWGLGVLVWRELPNVAKGFGFWGRITLDQIEGNFQRKMYEDAKENCEKETPPAHNTVQKTQYEGGNKAPSCPYEGTM